MSSEPVDIYQNPGLSMPVDPDCVLNEAVCESKLAGGGTIGLMIGPKPILGASPLKFELSTQNLEVESAVIDLEGVDMNMGRYRFELDPDGESKFVAAGNLPVCVRNQMVWQADVWLNTRNQGLIKQSYIFTAYKY